MHSAGLPNPDEAGLELERKCGEHKAACLDPCHLRDASAAKGIGDSGCRPSQQVAVGKDDLMPRRSGSAAAMRLVRAIIAFSAIIVVAEPLLLRALEVYEVERIDVAEAYLVASAEASGVETVASFDRTIDRVTTIRRVEPS